MVSQRFCRLPRPHHDRHFLARPSSSFRRTRWLAASLLPLDCADSVLRAAIREEPVSGLHALGHVWSRPRAIALLSCAGLSPATAQPRTSSVSRNRAIGSTLVGITRALGHALVSEQVARQPGLLQALDPRVRVAGLFSLVLAVTLSHRISVVLALFCAAILIAVLSRVSLAILVTRVWLVVLLFTGVIALPALFLTPGDAVFTTPGGALRITSQGVATALLLIARVETAVTFTTLLVLCTPWMHVLKALRAFRIPPEVVMMLAMTHRYVFVLAETASQMFESRQSRTVGVLDGPTQRRITARTAGVLLSRSIELSNEVFLAMQSRGFRGDVQILSEFRMRAWDYIGLTAFLAAGALAVWMGRR